jgi:hypothetical protein
MSTVLRVSFDIIADKIHLVNLGILPLNCSAFGAVQAAGCKVESSFIESAGKCKLTKSTAIMTSVVKQRSTLPMV